MTKTRRIPNTKPGWVGRYDVTVDGTVQGSFRRFMSAHAWVEFLAETAPAGSRIAVIEDGATVWTKTAGTQHALSDFDITK